MFRQLGLPPGMLRKGGYMGQLFVRAQTEATSRHSTDVLHVTSVNTRAWSSVAAWKACVQKSRAAASVVLEAKRGCAVRSRREGAPVLCREWGVHRHPFHRSATRRPRQRISVELKPASLVFRCDSRLIGTGTGCECEHERRRGGKKMHGGDGAIAGLFRVCPQTARCLSNRARTVSSTQICPLESGRSSAGPAHARPMYPPIQGLRARRMDGVGPLAVPRQPPHGRTACGSC